MSASKAKHRARREVDPPRPKVSVQDTLMEALRLADETEAVASLIDAYLVETGPAVVHAAVRLLARTVRQLGRELYVLVDHDDERRRLRFRRRR